MANDARRDTGSTTGSSETAVDRKVLLGELEVAYGIYRDKDYERAKLAFTRVRANAARAGIRSAHVEWGLAITYDSLGDFERALLHIGEALTLDPLDLQYNHSYRVICEHMRGALKLAEEQGEGDDIEPLHRLLTHVREADVESHFVMARFLVRVGRVSEAVRILDAVTVLNPLYSAAWAHLAEAAQAAGDVDLAERARFESACCPTAGNDLVGADKAHAEA